MAVAAGIAEHLRRTRIEWDGKCTWMGWTQREIEGGELESVYGTCGPDLYGGTSGVGLFLAEVAVRTGDAALAGAAEAALGHSLSGWTRIDPRFRLSFYCGAVGVAWSAIRVGKLLDRSRLIEAGVEILRKVERDDGGKALLDVISGAAGAIPPLLALADQLGRPKLVAWAERQAERIIAAAEKTDEEWSWGDDATGFHSARHLTGLGHGAAGFGWALLEMFRATGRSCYLEGAERAFEYERSWFREPPGNWPDFRFFDGEREPPPYGLAWCQGAPGIGLTRLRALEIRPDDRYRAEAIAALRAVGRGLAEGPPLAERDFSFCHGLAGMGDFLIEAARSLPDQEAGAYVDLIAGEGARAHGRSPETWRSGVPAGASPTLMLGQAGIGYFFLRRYDPTLASVLLVGPGRRA